VACVKLFMEKARGAGQIAPQVAEAMVKAGFKQAKPKVVEACRKVRVACIANTIYTELEGYCVSQNNCQNTHTHNGL
jgi:hypothetical protein